MRLAAELDVASNVLLRFVYANRSNIPDFMVKYTNSTTSGIYRILSDHLGSLRMVVNATNASDRPLEARYSAFGIPTAISGSLAAIPFGFAGGPYDADTGLVRFGARDYDARFGRWTHKDPILFGGGQTNLYVYVHNDPVNYVDPRGRMELPLDPSGLGPDWRLDPSHRHPHGERWRHPSGDYLDFHKAQPGKPGNRGKDHWHHNGGQDHLKPGTEVSDPASQCSEGNHTAGEVEDEEEAEPTPESDNAGMIDWSGLEPGTIPILPMPFPFPPMPMPFPMPLFI